MKPLRLLGALLVAIAGVLAFVADGSARKPQPLSGPTITNTSGSIASTGATSGDLMIKWTESDVPLNETSLQYGISGEATATYVCLAATGAVEFSSSCANPVLTQGGNPACSVTDGPGDLLYFTFVGLSGTKTTVSNTVALDEAYSSDLSNYCSSNGGNLLLYQVEYNGIQMWDITTGAPAVYVGGGAGDFGPTTFCDDTRLASCPSVS